MILVARIFSIVFKVAALPCIGFGLLFAKRIIDAQSVSDISRSSFPEFYALQVVLAFFVPITAGAFLLLTGFVLDVWIIGRLNHLLLQTVARRVGEYDV